MSIDRKIYITNKGKDLLIEAAKGGYEFQPLKVVLGNGLTHAGQPQEEIEKVTAIESPKVTLNELSVEKQSPNIAIVRAKLNTSEVINDSFRASETGLIVRLKSINGSYYPNESGILYSYRNIGEEGDWIPAKTSGEAWSLSYNIATVISNVSAITPVIKGDITREEFNEHINSKSPHKNFMITGNEVEEINYVNVNYAGSGNKIDFISFDKFKDNLNDGSGIVDTYIEKDKTKKILDEMDNDINQFIPNEIISNTTVEDINNFYCTEFLSGNNFSAISKMTVSDGVILSFKLNDFNVAKSFLNDNQILPGQDLIMINKDAGTETTVQFVGLNWSAEGEKILFKVSKDPGELAKDSLEFHLTTALVVPGKVFPNKLFNVATLSITSPGLNWNEIKPSPGTATITNKYVIGNTGNLNLVGNIAQKTNEFKTSKLNNDNYFNVWNFNNNINNSITSGTTFNAVGTVLYNDGLFNNKALKTASDAFVFNKGSEKGIYSKISGNKDFWFESWIKPSVLNSNEQVIYNEFQTIKKNFPTDENTVFFVNFDGDTLETRLKDKIYGGQPVVGAGVDALTPGGLPNAFETSYQFEKNDNVYAWLINQEKLGEGEFTFEYFNSSDMCNNNGIAAGLCYIYEKDGNKWFADIALHEITGRTTEYDNFRCYKPNVLPLNSEGVLTSDWSFNGTNYQNFSFNETPGSLPHWYSNHYCWHFSYSKAGGINLISNMFKRSSTGNLESIATSEMAKQEAYGGEGTNAYSISIPSGAKFLGLGVFIRCPYGHSEYYGGWADEIRITKGIIDKSLSAGKILPVRNSFIYQTIGYKSSPIYKVSLSSIGSGNDLVLERFKEFSGNGDNRVAKVIKYTANLNDKLNVDDWNHITITDKEKVPELFVGSTKIFWTNNETIDYRFDEEFLEKNICTLIGGDKVNDLENPTQISSGLFNGLIQDVGMGTIPTDGFTPIEPLIPILSETPRGMAYAINTNQAISYFNKPITGITEAMKVISGTVNGEVYFAFAKEAINPVSIHLYKLTLNSSNKIELVSIGNVSLEKSNLYHISTLLKSSGNSGSTINQFLGKEFVVESPNEDLFLYPFIAVYNNDASIKNFELDKLTTSTTPIYKFVDSKILNFEGLKKIAYVNSVIDEDSSKYDSMSLEFFGLTSDDEWEELKGGLQKDLKDYKSFKATLNVDFSSTHKEDGVLKILSVDCVNKNNLCLTSGMNSCLALKPIIGNDKKVLHSFIKYTNFDMITSNIYDFKVQYANLKKNVDSFVYNNLNKTFYLSKNNILLGDVLRKPGAETPEKIGDTIKVIITDSSNNYLKTLDPSSYSFVHSINEGVLKVGITIASSLEIGSLINVVYYTADLSNEVSLNKISDSNYLNSILVQHSRMKLSSNNIVLPKIEIKTNNYIDYFENTGIKTSGKNETFIYNLKRKVNINSVKIFIAGTEVSESLITATGGDGNKPLIIKANLASLPIGIDVFVQFKYLGSSIIDGFSDLGIICN